MDAPTSVIINADVVEGLRALPTASVQCVMTSPPYYGLRSYGIPPRKWADGTECVLGEEDTLQRYIDHLIEVFRELKRVLHPTGTFWLNLGDGYAGGGKHVEPVKYAEADAAKPTRAKQKGMSGKNLMMVPARAALALQADGWILRQDIIWAKGVSFCPTFSGSVMPESTTDRPTWSHEHLFMFSLNEDYYYDPDGCREPYADSTLASVRVGYRGKATKQYEEALAQDPSDTKRRVLASVETGAGRNLRNVWIIGKQNFKGAHFATFPEKLVDPVVRLSTSEKGCCGTCGTPIRRRTVREPVPDSVKEAFEHARVASAETSGRTDGHTRRKPNFRRRVIRTEWEAGCGCGLDSGVRGSGGASGRAAGPEEQGELGHRNIRPCVVLDPFNGSGRTGVVAVRLGRSYRGIEINPAFVEMAERAISAVRQSDDGRGAGEIRVDDDAAERGNEQAEHPVALASAATAAEH